MLPEIQRAFPRIKTHSNDSMSDNLSTVQWNDEDAVSYSNSRSSNIQHYKINASGPQNYVSGPPNYNASCPVYLLGYPQSVYDPFIPSSNT